VTTPDRSADGPCDEYGGGATVAAGSECSPGELSEPCDCGVGGVEEQDAASAVGDSDFTETLTAAGNCGHDTPSLTELLLLYTGATQLADRDGDEAIARSRETVSAAGSKSADDGAISFNSECSDVAPSAAGTAGRDTSAIT